MNELSIVVIVGIIALAVVAIVAIFFGNPFKGEVAKDKVKLEVERRDRGGEESVHVRKTSRSGTSVTRPQ